MFVSAPVLRRGDAMVQGSIVDNIDDDDSTSIVDNILVLPYLLSLVATGGPLIDALVARWS